MIKLSHYISLNINIIFLSYINIFTFTNISSSWFTFILFTFKSMNGKLKRNILFLQIFVSYLHTMFFLFSLKNMMILAAWTSILHFCLSWVNTFQQAEFCCEDFFVLHNYVYLALDLSWPVSVSNSLLAFLLDGLILWSIHT